MANGSKIGNLSFCKGLRLLQMDEYSILGNLNWITGQPLDQNSFFQHRIDRDPSLIMLVHSSITHRHIIDCTDKIMIGKFSVIAGYRSQFLTHAIDISLSRQDCSPILIGDYCFISTNCVLLPGSSIGNYCVLGASSLLNKAHSSDYTLYGGVPAKPLQSLSKELKFFTRKIGFVY